MDTNLNFKEIEALILSDSYLTTKQASIYLGIGVKSLADYRSKKRKPHFIKRGNAIRYSPDSIIDFIKIRNKAKYIPQYDDLHLPVTKNIRNMLTGYFLCFKNI